MRTKNLALGTAASVDLLGDDKLRQAILDKIQKIPDGTVPPQHYIPGTSPDREKSFAEMMLMASLGRTQDVVKMIEGLKDKGETFQKGLEPQVRVTDRLTVTGKPDAAKELMKATRDINFGSGDFKGAWTDPHGPPALTLIKAYLNEGRLQDAQEVAALLAPPNPFSRNVTDAAVQELFARYKAPKDAKPAPEKTPPAGAVKFTERENILKLLKDGKTEAAQTALHRNPGNRNIVLTNIMRTFADDTTKPAKYDEIFHFYMQGCEELYPQLKARSSRCLLRSC